MTTQNKTVPALRFPEFNGDWEKKRLKEICNKILDGTHFSPKSTEGTKKYLTSKNIRNGGLDLSNVNYISEEEHRNIYKRCPVKFGDVLLTKDGANTGNCCINTLKEEFSLLSSVAVLDGKQDLLDNVFLLQILQSTNGINTINNVMAGQAISRITLEKINNFKFLFPKFPEQQKIAAFLTAVDEKIQQLAKKKDLLEQYKKGVMQKIFNQEIRFKDDNGNDFADWEEKKLEPYLKLYVERVKSDTDIPILTSSRNGLFMQKDYFDDRELTNEGEYGVVPRGYFTYRHMSDDSTFKFNINNLCDKGAVSKEYPVFTTQGLDSLFLQLKLNKGDEFKRFAIEQKRGGTRTRLYFNKLTQLAISLPSLPEQQKIVSFLSAIGKKINSVNQQLEKTKEYKKGLLQKMFV